MMQVDTVDDGCYTPLNTNMTASAGLPHSQRANDKNPASNDL